MKSEISGYFNMDEVLNPNEVNMNNRASLVKNAFLGIIAMFPFGLILWLLELKTKFFIITLMFFALVGGSIGGYLGEKRNRKHTWIWAIFGGIVISYILTYIFIFSFIWFVLVFTPCCPG